MTTMKSFYSLRNVLLGLLGGAVAGACAACGSSASNPPAAYVAAEVGQTSGTGTCNLDQAPDTPYFTLGSESTQGPQPVANEAAFMGVDASVACIVHATAATTYQVTAQISVGALFGFTVSGTISDTPGTQQNINVFVSQENMDSYAEKDCTFTLSSKPAAQNPPQPAITSGRVWGTATCPNFGNTQDSVTCSGSIEFQLSNCDD